MQQISLALALLAGISGAYLGYRAFMSFKSMIKGPTSLRFLILKSITAGAAGTLIFFSLIMIIGFLDESYIWDIHKFIGAITISLMPGLIIGMGSFVQAMMISQYRRILLDIFRRRKKDK